jgi:hypothetical protein
MFHMEKLQLEISWGVILQMHTPIVVIVIFGTFNVLGKKKWNVYLFNILAHIS